MNNRQVEVLRFIFLLRFLRTTKGIESHVMNKVRSISSSGIIRRFKRRLYTVPVMTTRLLEFIQLYLSINPFRTAVINRTITLLGLIAKSAVDLLKFHKRVLL